MTCGCRTALAGTCACCLRGSTPVCAQRSPATIFAGYSNRFWKLLSDSSLTPRLLTYEDDVRLPSWRLGISNLIARPSPGIDDLRPAEYVEGWRILKRKIRQHQPEVVALLGVTLFRAILPLLDDAPAPAKGKVIGAQPIAIHGARLFVLPNPSGRNANFSYSEMLRAFIELRGFLENDRNRLR